MDCILGQRDKRAEGKSMAAEITALTERAAELTDALTVELGGPDQADWPDALRAALTAKRGIPTMVRVSGLTAELTAVQHQLVSVGAYMAMPLGKGVMSDIRSMLEALCEAFNAHDLDAVMAYFADDCMLEMPRGPDPWGARGGQEGGARSPRRPLPGPP